MLIKYINILYFIFFTNIIQATEITTISWNIQAQYFDELDQTEDKLHHWATRRPAVIETIRQLTPDIIGLQEVSPVQGLQLQELSEYEAIYLPLQQSAFKNKILLQSSNLESIKFRDDLLMNGILYKNENWDLLEKGSLLLHEETRQIEDIFKNTDHKNRLGSMIHYRGMIYANLKHKSSQKSVWIFNSQYPLDAQSQLLSKCGTIEKNFIDETGKESFWISLGDRNNFSHNRTVDTTSLSPLLTNAYNAWDLNESKGLSTTFVGFSGTPIDNPITTEGTFQHNLITDVIISNKKALFAEHILPEFYKNKVVFNPSSFNLKRPFASDHALVKAVYNLN